MYSIFQRLLLLGALIALAIPVSATSVRAIDFAQLCEQAALIFEGRVTSLETRQELSAAKIWTIVTFEITSVIKGQANGETIELEFLGGTVGDLSLRVGEMQIPELNESGIYFVESLDVRQPNPLLGWAQGHFRIEADSGNTMRVFTADRRPISGVNQDLRAPGRGLSTGAVLGTEIADPEAGTDAISVEEFKRRIGEQLDKVAR